MVIKEKHLSQGHRASDTVWLQTSVCLIPKPVFFFLFISLFNLCIVLLPMGNTGNLILEGLN